MTIEAPHKYGLWNDMDDKEMGILNMAGCGYMQEHPWANEQTKQIVCATSISPKSNGTVPTGITVCASWMVTFSRFITATDGYVPWTLYLTTRVPSQQQEVHKKALVVGLSAS